MLGIGVRLRKQQEQYRQKREALYDAAAEAHKHGFYAISEGFRVMAEELRKKEIK